MSPLSYYRKLTAFFLGLCVFVFAQSEPPATDANWSGFVANTYGPFFNGTQVSTMSATGDIFVASRVGTAIKVAHWDSRQWEFLGDRLQLLNGSNANVSDIVALSNGDVYLAGNFDTAFNENGSTTTATYIAYWEAATRLWKPVGQGTSAPATQMFVDEVNAKVYLVGPQSATNQDGTIVTLNKIGLWDIAQQTWQPIGQGVPAVGIPMSVVVDDAGNILVGGRFLEVLESDGTAIAANNIARWDGQNWFPLAGGLFAVDPPFVTSLTLDRNNRLYVGGRFNYAVNGDGSTVNGPVVSWDGSIWTGTVHPAALDIMGLETDPLNRVYSLYLDPATFVPYVVLLDGGTWQRIARPVGEFARSLSGNRRYQGTRIYLGGLFRSILAPQGEAPIENNAYWNGAWHPMLDVTLVNGGVNAFSSRANNSDLYIGGGFTEIGSIDANNLARFSGTSWDSINGGLNGPVHALAANPGIGVVVGGEFNEARNSDGSPVSALNVAYLNGSDEWMTLGGGVNGPVYAVLNRSGAVSTGRLGEIIVGGSFNTAYNPDGSSVSVNALAMWDWGTERWHPVAGDLIGNNAVVRALTPDFTDRARSFLNFFVGGRFDGAINPGGGTVNCANILMWQQVGEPDQWVALGRGTDGMVNAIAFGHSNAYRTFYGQHIWVGGDFQSSRNADGGNVRTPYLSLFDLSNSSWRALAGGTDGIVRAIAPIRSMPYQGAFVGGDFNRGYYSDGSFETLNHVGLFKLDPLQYNQQPAWNQRGINALNGSVKALISTSPCLGNAETVMAGGVFNRAGSIPVGNLARWRYRWQISLGAINIATTSRGSGGGGVRGVSTRTNCTYVNSKTDPEPYGVVFDSLGFGESVVIDSFPRFTPSQFLLYDVDRP
ncbi:MAG: hypothetical protein KDI06_07230, partial [Calditrichaeota bacterium]|nr:hypothetical protein [Calditrichota bacterium]